MLRSGTQLDGPKGASVGVESQKEHDKDVTPLHCENEPQEKRESQRPKESKSLSPQPYMPPLLFSQRFVKAKPDSHCSKFLDILKKLHVTVTFIDALKRNMQ